MSFLVASIEAGAGEQHWAFETPSGGPGDVDFYVRAGFPSGVTYDESQVVADKHTLARRLSFDLRGIPPSPAEVHAFVEDESPNAWANLVDRYMASPQFGETMAQQWLDLARYADTSGYAADRTRTIWPYRDWVVRSFNENMPFDQFVVEQLAGDMLPNATPEQRLATGFHRNAMQAKGNNPRKEEFRIKGVVDRLTTTGRALLGLSIECAECHDHKYDPISQQEYYQLFAIFNNVPHLGEGYGVHGPRMNYLSQEDRENRRRVEQELASLGPPPAWTVAGEPIGQWDGPAVVEDSDAFSVIGDFSIVASVSTQEPVADIVSKYDWRGKERSYVFGIGGEGDKNGTPGHLFAWVSENTDPFKGVEIHSSRPVNDGLEHEIAVVARTGQSIHLIIDGVEDTNAKVIGKMPKSVAVSDRRLAVGAGYDDSEEPKAFRFGDGLHHVRIFDVAIRLPERSRKHLELESRLKAIDAKVLALPVMSELPNPRETHVLVRGDFKEKGARVEPGLPKILPPLKLGQPLNRITFARWLTDEKHPLTSRVAVNYLWQYFFGEGLVSTSADFGTQGARPSHPELLDWLAAEFVRSGWDRKHIVRLMVNSQTYKRSSLRTGLNVESKWLVRMPRRRHAAEQIRDNALAVSGLLSRSVGGPPVFPLQPNGYYEERAQNTAGNSDFSWIASMGSSRYRRSLYVYWKRMALHPSMAALDAPARQVCKARRSTTNTPQQALVTLNDPMFHECAIAFGLNIQAAGGTDDERIDYAFLKCLSRLPEPDERARFLRFLDRSSRKWESVAAVLLNLDESLTRE